MTTRLTIRHLLASTVLVGAFIAGHAQAATATKDFAACVWDGTSDADRTALAGDPSHLSGSGAFDKLAQDHPSANAAFDQCRGGTTTPALWKGHFLFNLGMEHWAMNQLKAKAVDADHLETAWTSLPAPQQACLGILTAWAIVEVNKSDEANLSSTLGACNASPARDGMQSFMHALNLDAQSDAGKLAGMYAFGKGGEAIVLGLMTHAEATAAGASPSQAQ